MGLPSPPLENCDLSLCPSDILLLLQQPLQTQRGGKKIPLPAISFFRQLFPLEKRDLTSFRGLWFWFGFPGEKMHLFVWGFLSDNPCIVVHLPVCFFPSLICMQWVLCPFQGLPCGQGTKKQDSPGTQPSKAHVFRWRDLLPSKL